MRWRFMLTAALLVAAGTLGAVVFAQLGGTQTASGAASVYSDDFEAATIDPFWSVTEQYGTVELSSDQAHSGSQSAKFSSTSGGQRQISLAHDFPDVTKGSVSVWFYDTTAGQNTLYALLDIFNSTVAWGEPGYRFHVGVWDSNPDWYGAADGITTVLTSIPKTVGWHEFKIAYNSSSVQILIDGTEVASYAGDYGFDRSVIGVFGPSWRPNGTFYWDDFNVEAPPLPVGVGGIVEVSADGGAPAEASGGSSAGDYALPLAAAVAAALVALAAGGWYVRRRVR
jgi:hypothetical protein